MRCRFKSRKKLSATALAIGLDPMAPYGSIVAVPAAAHAGIQIVLAEEQLPLAAGELRSLVGVDHHLGLGFAPPDSREQGLQGQIGCHAGLSGPADEAA